MVRPFARYAELAAIDDAEARHARPSVGRSLLLVAIGAFVSLTSRRAARRRPRRLDDGLLVVPPGGAGPRVGGGDRASSPRPETPLRRALALYFTGHGPWLFFLLLLAGVCLFAPDVYGAFTRLLRHGVLPGALLVALVWSGVLTYACFRDRARPLAAARGGGDGALLPRVFRRIVGYYLAMNQIQPQLPGRPRERRAARPRIAGRLVAIGLVGGTRSTTRPRAPAVLPRRLPRPRGRLPRPHPLQRRLPLALRSGAPGPPPRARRARHHRAQHHLPGHHGALVLAPHRRPHHPRRRGDHDASLPPPRRRPHRARRRQPPARRGDRRHPPRRAASPSRRTRSPASGRRSFLPELDHIDAAEVMHPLVLSIRAARGWRWAEMRDFYDGAARLGPPAHRDRLVRLPLRQPARRLPHAGLRARTTAPTPCSTRSRRAAPSSTISTATPTAIPRSSRPSSASRTRRAPSDYGYRGSRPLGSSDAHRGVLRPPRPLALRRRPATEVGGGIE